MKSKAKEKLQEDRLIRTNLSEAHDQQQDHELDRFGMKLIKGIGIFGVFLGGVILLAFWYWVIRSLFKVL